MKKSDFKINDFDLCTIKEALDNKDEVYMICIKDGDYTLQEVHTGDTYIGGDGFKYVSDSNVGYDTSSQVMMSFLREYGEDGIIAFDEEYLRDEFMDENDIND